MSERIIRPSFTRTDERGTLYELLNSGTWRSVVQGDMTAGAVMGNHYHQETRVFYFLLSGRASIVIQHVQDGTHEHFDLNPMEGVIFEPYEAHSVTFSEPGSYLLLKSLPYDPQNADTYHHPVG